jgi:hypothetical protein
MLHRIIQGIAPAIAFAAAVSVSGCDGNLSINGKEGKPLAELETAGKTPSHVILAGPDSVLVKDGSALKIEVAGDPAAVEALRFTLDDRTLGIMRKKSEGRIDGKATVTVTLPALEKITVAGSGSLEAPSLSGRPEVVIAGSGTAHAANVVASKLEVTIAGSGTFRAGGKTDSLELTVAGSGTAEMAGLEADTAEVTVAGSGDAAFASNGTVKATVVGSGDVTVTGSAKCTIKSMGSGTLRCQSGTVASDGTTPPAPPAPPEAPKAPETPE